ncbi:MAG: plasmid pRiA4b ORF-3 family protein [Dehalococcoidia bacterium]|nr:plasmid pRiA4b ORF-3 family protein [Dehalococcoidia bacterium]
MTEEAGAIPRGAAKSVYQLKVTLRDIKPPVWRRILVAGDIRLDKLHGILQWVMGWQNSHLHQFLIRGAAYGTPDPDFDLDVRDEKRMRLDQALADPGSKIVYEYDFGDGWTHDVLLEKILPPDRDTDYPVCIKGKRACPPEDCGGPWGYEELLQTLRDPAHPEHEDLLRWAGGQVDPDAFDLEETNAERDDYMQLLAEERGRFGY